ncbi:MAG: hypothetical protein K8R36_16780 [Planctomycetales bacterium]|nr:hypothetical protein [Planctomycetales bacterium]
MSESLEIPCGGCGKTLRVSASHAGKMARCPVCGHITHVPASLTSTNVSELTTASGQRELTDEMAFGEVGRPAPNSPTTSPAPVAPSSPVTIHGDAAEWYMKTPEEQVFGPASFQDLERWVKDGRITSDCQLCQGAASNWQPADWLFPSLKAQPTFHPTLTPPTPAPTFSQPGFSPSQYPPPGGNLNAPPGTYGPAGRYQVPHRGPLILVLAILGLFIQCPIFPLMSWVMGSNDLREMQAGRMDPAGRDLTRAGMVIGMVLSILWIAGILFLFVAMFAGIVGN